MEKEACAQFPDPPLPLMIASSTPARPAEAIRERLRALGGHWSKRRQAWYFTGQVDLTWLT